MKPSTELGMQIKRRIYRLDLKQSLRLKQKAVIVVETLEIYQDLIKGRFEINVIRIERTSNIDNDISNKLFDYSTDTIKQLTSDGFDRCNENTQ